MLCREQSSVRGADALACYILSPANRIIWTNLFLDEIIMVEANDGESLLHGGSRETASRVKRENLGASRISPCGEILDVEGKAFTSDDFRKEMVTGAEGQVIVEVAPIDFNGGRS